MILSDLFSGTKRFGELRVSLTGISPKTLAERLRAMEQMRIVARKIYPEMPPRGEYSLATSGQTLKPIIGGMREWGERRA